MHYRCPLLVALFDKTINLIQYKLSYLFHYPEINEIATRLNKIELIQLSVEQNFIKKEIDLEKN